MSDGRRSGSTRKRVSGDPEKRSEEDGQLGLFETEASLAAHWPEYVAGAHRPPPAASALVQWAESFPHLSKRTRAVLVALAREAGDARTCQICLHHLAPAIGIGRNTVKRCLEKLMAAGLVMMREQRAFGARSYDFHLIVDLEDRASAIADGFVPYRPVGRL